MDKKFRLPKEAFIDDQDVEGHRRPPTDATPEGEGFNRRPGDPDSDIPTPDEDVEGHRLPGDGLTILPAPPSIGLRRTPGHGGE